MSNLYPVSVLPARHPYLGEQTLLTFNDATGSWDLVHLDFGDELDLEEFVLGVSHWIDLVHMEPDDVAAREAARDTEWAERDEPPPMVTES